MPDVNGPEVRDGEWAHLASTQFAADTEDAFRRLNSVRVRGLRKVNVHVMLSIIVLQAQALATQSRMLVRKVA